MVAMPWKASAVAAADSLMTTAVAGASWQLGPAALVAAATKALATDQEQTKAVFPFVRLRTKEPSKTAELQKAKLRAYFVPGQRCR